MYFKEFDLKKEILSFQQKKASANQGLQRLLVPGAGIEPAHLAILEFESSASTNSANRACNWDCKYRAIFILEKLFLNFFKNDFHHKSMRRNIPVKSRVPDRHKPDEHYPEVPFPFDFECRDDAKYASGTFSPVLTLYIKPKLAAI